MRGKSGECVGDSVIAWKTLWLCQKLCELVRHSVTAGGLGRQIKDRRILRTVDPVSCRCNTEYFWNNDGIQGVQSRAAPWVHDPMNTEGFLDANRDNSIR